MTIHRRQFIQTVALSAASGSCVFAQNSEVKPPLIHYMESLRKPDGGWGWAEQFDSYLGVTFSVLGAYHVLGIPVPEPEKVVSYLLNYAHPLEGKGRQSRQHCAEPKFMVYQLMQSLVWLGAESELKRFRSRVLNWKKPSGYSAGYELGENPPLDQEAFPFLCRQLLGEPCDELREIFEPYFTARQRPDGSFNAVPAGDAQCDGPGNVICAFRALQAFQASGWDLPRRNELARWFAACQREDGGFTHAPNPELGNVSDVYYTWCACSGLNLLNREDLIKKDALAKWLKSLVNPDGGFADRPGAASNPMTLYYALDLASPLRGGGLAEAGGVSVQNAERSFQGLEVIPASHHVYTIQFEAPGFGSVSEAVEVARRLRISLWGAKNSTPQWIAAAQERADEQGVPVTFFPSDERYGSVRPIPGYGRFTHLDDPFESPVSAETKQKFQIWQACDHEPVCRLLLDEVELHGGYDLIAAFHFGCWNFIATMPYLKRYEHTIPLTALQDAHTESWWWREQLTAFRTLFIAEKPTWDGWLDALAHKRVVAVRNDQWTQNRLRILGGSPSVRQFITDHETEWKWWDEYATTRAFPKEAVSIQRLKPGAKFEPGAKPDRAVLRIRTNRAWIENQVLVPVGSQVEVVRARLADGTELELHHDLKILEEPNYLKGRVQEDSTYADLPNAETGVEVTFRVDGKEFSEELGKH